MAISFSKMTDDEIGAMVRDRYERLCAAHDAGMTDSHPRDQWNADSAVLRTARDKARDEAGLGPVTIQKRGSSSEEGASDNPPPTPGTPRAPVQDGQLEHGTDGIARFTTAAGKVLVGDKALEAHAGQSNPTRAANMAARIKGYNRIP